jgi:serine/threonine protein kinase
MGNAGLEEPTGGAEPDGAIVRIGTVVDKYTIVRVLGRGGMGAVYEARHAKLARRVAIKFLLPEFAANRDVLRRFENEAKAAGGLEHPNLAAVTDFGRADDGSPYLVMEFLEGEDCAKLLRRQGALSVSRAANIVVQACRGLAVAHKATIVHRDLKPENLFVTDAGDGSDLIKVLDFGIAKLRVSDASVVTGTGATFGTAFYMSPEQARGAGEVDPRTDVWSLGVVLYELLSGRKPFMGEQFLEVIHQILSLDPTPLATLRPDLPPKVVAAVESAMKKDSAQRLSSVAALAEVLAPFAGVRWSSEPSHAAPPMAPTLATPATQVGLSKGVGVGVGELGVQASVARRPESRAPGTSRGPALKIVLGVGTAVALIAVIVLTLSRRPGENAAPLGAPPSPRPTIGDPHADVPAPAPRPATTPATLPSPTPSPARTAEVAPHVRTAFEHSRSGSNKHATHPSPTSGPSAAPPERVASPAPPLDNPARSHRIEIDKDDPFGP